MPFCELSACRDICNLLVYSLVNNHSIFRVLFRHLKKKSVVQSLASFCCPPLVCCHVWPNGHFFIRKLPRRRNGEKSRAAQAEQHRQRRANQREQILGQVRRVVFVQQPNQVRQEVVIQPAERVVQAAPQNRAAIQQPAAEPVQDDDEDILQIKLQEDEQDN